MSQLFKDEATFISAAGKDFFPSHQFTRLLVSFVYWVIGFMLLETAIANQSRQKRFLLLKKMLQLANRDAEEAVRQSPAAPLCPASYTPQSRQAPYSQQPEYYTPPAYTQPTPTYASPPSYSQPDYVSPPPTYTPPPPPAYSSPTTPSFLQMPATYKPPYVPEHNYNPPSFYQSSLIPHQQF